MKLLTEIIILLAITISFPVRLSAQLTAKMTNKGVGYLEHLPPDYASNPTKKYPLMLFLHGTGEKGDGSPTALEKVKANGPPKEIKNGHNMCFEVNGQTECFIVIAPQLESSKPSWGVSIIDDVFKYVFNGPENYRVDMNRVYLTGLSLGSNGVYKYAYMSVNDPNKLAAISPIAAWGDTNQGCVISERKIPLWAFHGDQDNTVGYGGGLAMFNSIKDCTTPAPTQELIFTTYEGVGHNSWSRAYRTDNTLHNPNLYEWMLSKSLGGNPTANAGVDKEITLPTNSIVLNGSGSDPGGSITNYSWIKLSGPTATLTNASTANLTASNLLEGIYSFQLTVTDNDGNTALDIATVTVNQEAGNLSPTANAGSDIQLVLPITSTNITGVASDNDGSIASVVWSQISGPSTAAVTGTTSNTLTVSNLVEGAYMFRFTVTDNESATAFDEVIVEVINNATNQAPVANAGNNFSLKLPTNTTSITGSGTDSDGSISSYLWERIGGPGTISITNPTSATATLSNLVEGVYHMQLTVTDNLGATDIDDVYLAVLAANVNPIANAGSDISITLPTNSSNVTGSGSDGDGSIQSYAWIQLSGPSTSTLSNSNKAQMTASNLISGTYTFQLTVTDNNGATDNDEMSIIVNAAPVNAPPTVNAGDDISITLPANSVILNGSATDSDGTIASYLWTKISGPATFSLSGTITNALTATNLVAGTYTFRLRVTDDDGSNATDNVIVTVAPESVNQSPSANAGPNRTITLPNNQVTFDGSGADPDGTISSYNWTQISGPSTASLTNNSTDDLTASNLIAGIYNFQMEVTDDEGSTATDQVTVTVSAANVPPIVSAGSDVNLTLPTNFVDIVGTASDPDGTVSLTSWSQTDGISAPFTVNGTTISITSLVAGHYTFQFQATDNQGAVSTDEVQVAVSASNVLPTVDAGADKSIVLPTNSVNLTGTANDADGTIVSYNWTKQSGPTTTLTNASTTTLTANNLLEGTYVFRLSATDNDGGVSFDNVQVVVFPATTNTAPIANAGNNISLVLPTNTTNINGSGSDSDGSIVSYNWTKVSGPNVTITNPNNSTVTLTNLLEGTYSFRLTVTDDDGASSSDDVNVTVSPEAVNQSPVANAGNDITITLPVNSTNLTGSSSDSDGAVVGYLWEQVSGPTAATITNASAATATVSDLIEGTYTFLLTTTDDDGAEDGDEIDIIVSPEGANQKPFANAGSDQTLNLPTNSINVTGSGSDPDGTITTYFWTKVSGPGATLSNINTPTLSIADMVEGSYVFKLTVTDNNNETGSDQMSIQVLAESINLSPSVDAGSDINIVLPTNSTSMNGTATDTDGSIVSTLWTQISGPSSAGFSDNTDLNVNITSLIEGSYVFRLTATDDDGADQSDQVNVTVLPEDTNTPPVANAGNNQEIFLPTNTASLNGSGTDSDGTLDNYFWEKVSGPSVTITDENSASTTLTNLLEGNYTLRLTVTDNDGATHSDDVLIKVFAESVNQSPIANAGDDIFLVLPDNNVTINGSGSSDPDGTISNFTWTVISGPNTPTVSGQTSQELTLNNLIQGIYKVQLFVEDNGGLSNTDDVNIFVDPEDPSEVTPPLVDAGTDQVLKLPQNSIQLIGKVLSGSLISSFAWTKISGGEADLEGIDNDTLNITNLKIGTYEFEFTATDIGGLSDSDQVIITIDGEEAVSDPLGGSDFPQKIFSPNGDGIGDNWIINPDVSLVENCELVIFDNRGIEVYAAKPYQNDWQGTYNGKELPEGVYFYIIKCEGNSKSYSGSITLLK
jgi:gliding motility-associated-like protein